MAESNQRLAGRVVIVSGASRRLGRCYAMALGKAGARVIALARTMGDDPDRMGTLCEVEASGRRAGYDVTAMRCDLEDEDAVLRLVDEVAGQFGRIDGIVNNAVLHAGRAECRGIEKERWDQAFAVNLRAPYLLIDRALPWLERDGGGSVVNITSLSAGPTGRGGGAHRDLLLYGLTKASLNRLTTWYGAELAERNVAVNAISPGDVSVYMRIVNGIDAESGTREIVAGEQVDESFWGNPVVWLMQARPGDVTGEILHTYTFGESWGPKPEKPVEWPPAIMKILGRDNLAAQPGR